MTDGDECREVPRRWTSRCSRSPCGHPYKCRSQLGRIGLPCLLMPAADSTSFSIPTSSLPKVRRDMRRLQKQVLNCWLASNESDFTLCRTHGPTADIEPFALELSPALVSVRAIDESFSRSYPRTVKEEPTSSPYVAFALTSPQGRATIGLAVPRNAEIHDSVIVDPHIDRVISRADGKGRVFPAWRPLHELTTEARETGKWRHPSYESDVSGRLVIETLLDALSFFVTCDPRIAARDDDGELDGFPLPPFLEFGYERRHPDWKRREETDVDLRTALRRLAPSGHRRVVTGALRDGCGEIEALCGWTIMDYGRSSSFTEPPAQVAEDMAMGYPYGMIDRTAAHDLTTPMTPLVLAALVELPDADSDRVSPWRLWWDFSLDDVGFYRGQRQPL